MEYISDMKYQRHHLHLEQYFIQPKHDLNGDIYVSITVCLHQVVHISWVGQNSKYSMLSNNYYNTVSVDNYYQYIFQIFMLAICVFIIRSLTLVYFELIANIQCYIFTRKTKLY